MKKHLVLIIIVVVMWGVFSPGTALAQGEPPQEPPHGNANCLMCHSDPVFTGNLPSGETVSLYVNPGEYFNSVHANAGLECLACHTGQKEYPHGESQLSCTKCHGDLSTLEEQAQDVEYQPLSVKLNYPDAREITLVFNEECRLCHEEKFAEAVDSAHSHVLEGGNRFAPVCVDCHGSHDVTPPDEPRAKISQTCAECHLSVYTTYQSSIHGEALEENGNPDVPTCVECHGVHSVSGPREPEFRDQMIAVCGSCHSDEERMSKYGISTAVFQTYLDDFHGRTVNFFRQQNPRQPSNKATCFDCHGIHNIRSPDDALSTVYPDNLQGTCQQCHEDASITFPQAWLGHYAPEWGRTPVLYAVNLGYQILVPTILTGFIGYIALDARKRWQERKHKTEAVEEETYFEEGIISDD